MAVSSNVWGKSARLGVLKERGWGNCGSTAFSLLYVYNLKLNFINIWPTNINILRKKLLYHTWLSKFCGSTAILPHTSHLGNIWILLKCKSIKPPTNGFCFLSLIPRNESMIKSHIFALLALSGQAWIMENVTWQWGTVLVIVG